MLIISIVLLGSFLRDTACIRLNITSAAAEGEALAALLESMLFDLVASRSVYRAYIQSMNLLHLSPPESIDRHIFDRLGVREAMTN